MHTIRFDARHRARKHRASSFDQTQRPQYLQRGISSRGPASNWKPYTSPESPSRDAPSSVSKRSGCEDPLDSRFFGPLVWSHHTCRLMPCACQPCPTANWHVLNLEACPELESIKTEIFVSTFFRTSCDQPRAQNPPALSLAGGWKTTLNLGVSEWLRGR